MNSLNAADNFYVYASMSGNWTWLHKLSQISYINNNFNLKLCYTPHIFFNSPFPSLSLCKTLLYYSTIIQ